MDEMVLTSLRESSGLAAGEIAARADDDGYVFVRGLLEPEPVLALRRRVLDACGRAGWADGDVVRDGVRLGAYDDEWVELQQEIVPSPEFKALGNDTRLLAALETILGGTPRGGVGAVCRVTSPAAGDLATPPHQDRHFIRQSERFWTAWIPLGDCPRQLGGLAVLAHSHRDGLREHGADDTVDVSDEDAWATDDYRCGDVLFVHCLTLHRAFPNETRDRLRVSVDYRYETAGWGVGGSVPNGAATSTALPLTIPPTTGPTGT